MFIFLPFKVSLWIHHHYEQSWKELSLNPEWYLGSWNRGFYKENFVCVCILLRSSVYELLTFFSFLNLFFLPLRQVVKPSFNLEFNPLCWLVLRASDPFTQKLWGVLVFTRKFSLSGEFGINDLEILLCSLTDNLRGTISLCLFFNLAVCTINWKLYIYIYFFWLRDRVSLDFIRSPSWWAHSWRIMHDN